MNLRNLLKHCEVPEKIVNIILNSYDGPHCKFVHRGQLTESFPVKTAVRQGCLLPVFFYLLKVDWIMKIYTFERRHGIQSTVCMQLNDFNFTHQPSLLSHIHQHMQVKTTSAAAVSETLGLNIHKGKDKNLQHNTENTNSVTLDGENLEEVESHASGKHHR
ncbi:unnamed protein product [Schistosoma margrebowiei]|uniref:Uncharacterized protein n=1 Tax=Schistosoma margrebowiei TaxID=48269 RepID=A0A183MYP6_9TREM|nr:unnamed protein product [Schistosoma margrebowiei]